jgi:hypothetical protein
LVVLIVVGVVLWLIAGFITAVMNREWIEDQRSPYSSYQQNNQTVFATAVFMILGGFVSLSIMICRQMPKHRLATADGTEKLQSLRRRRDHGKVLNQAVSFAPSYSCQCTLQVRHWCRWKAAGCDADWFSWRVGCDIRTAASEAA